MSTRAILLARLATWPVTLEENAKKAIRPVTLTAPATKAVDDASIKLSFNDRLFCVFRNIPYVLIPFKSVFPLFIVNSAANSGRIDEKYTR